MIILYDQDGSHGTILDELMKPLGIPYKVTKEFDESAIIDGKATTLIIYLTKPVDADLKDFLQVFRINCSRSLRLDSIQI